MRSSLVVVVIITSSHTPPLLLCIFSFFFASFFLLNNLLTKMARFSLLFLSSLSSVLYIAFVFNLVGVSMATAADFEGRGRARVLGIGSQNERRRKSGRKEEDERKTVGGISGKCDFFERNKGRTSEEEEGASTRSLPRRFRWLETRSICRRGCRHIVAILVASVESERTRSTCKVIDR